MGKDGEAADGNRSESNLSSASQDSFCVNFKDSFLKVSHKADSSHKISYKNLDFEY